MEAGNRGLWFFSDISEMNSLVIGVDILQYFKDLRERTDECYNVAADFVQLASLIEKKYDFPDYIPPVIMGYSSGATLVYGILAQSGQEHYRRNSVVFVPILSFLKCCVRLMVDCNS